MKEKISLFIIDADSINCYNYEKEFENFSQILNKKALKEKDSKVVIIITDLSGEKSELLDDIGYSLKSSLDNGEKVFKYDFKKMKCNFDLSGISARQIYMMEKRYKYSYIRHIIEKMNEKYDVIYTALMQDTDAYQTDEEFYAKEEIESIENLTKFNIILNSGNKFEHKGTYNNRLIISRRGGIIGLADGLDEMMKIEDGNLTNYNYHLFYDNGAKKNSGIGLLLIDASELDTYTYADESLYKNIKNVIAKNKLNDLYIVVTNQILGSKIKDELATIAKRLSFVLNYDYKIYIKENPVLENVQTEFNSNYGNLREFMKNITNDFSKKMKTDFKKIFYFSHYDNFERSKLFDIQSIYSKYDDPNIILLAHDSKIDIDNVNCSKKSKIAGLSDALNILLEKDNVTYQDDTNKEIIVFYSDFEDTISLIRGNDDLISELNDKLLELKDTCSAEKVYFCLITNEPGIGLLRQAIETLDGKLDKDIIFKDHFYPGGAIINKKAVDNYEVKGYHKFEKIGHHINNLVDQGYNIKHIYFADSSMFNDYILDEFEMYYEDDIDYDLLIPGFNNPDDINRDTVSSTEKYNIHGVLELIDSCIQKEKGSALVKKYMLEDDDDDDLPF